MADAPARSSPAVLVLAVLLTALTVAGVVASITLGARIPAATTTREVLRPLPDVLRAVHDLARLEAVSYHMERVIDLREEQSRALGLVHAEDAILLVAVGDVVAGVDLAALGPNDVAWSTDRRRVTLTLAPPTVLSATLDESRTYVHHRSTDLLARRQESLETRARQEAARSLRAAALEAGILARARRNTEATLRSLVGALGAAEVVVVWREP